MRLNEAIQLYVGVLRNVKARPTTAASYSDAFAHLEDFFGDAPLSEVFSTSGVTAYADMLRSAKFRKEPGEPLRLFSTAWRRHRLAAAASLGKFLLNQGLIEANAFSDVKTFRKQGDEATLADQLLSIDQLRAMLAAVRSGTSPLEQRNALLFQLLYATGLRVSEAISLETGNLDLESGFVTVIGKRGKPRSIPIPDVLISEIRRYLMETQPRVAAHPSNCLLPGRKGGHISRFQAFRIIRAIGRAAGIAELHPHQLRHCFAYHALNKGLDILDIRAILGHESVTTTAIYLDADQAKAFGDHRRSHPLNRRADPSQ